jgi:hypothetical protein
MLQVQLRFRLSTQVFTVQDILYKARVLKGQSCDLIFDSSPRPQMQGCQAGTEALYAFLFSEASIREHGIFRKTPVKGTVSPDFYVRQAKMGDHTIDSKVAL